MVIRSGKLRHSILIQERSTTPDTAGDPLDVWTSISAHPIRCGVEPQLSGRELEAAQQREGRVLTKFRLRYRSGLTPAMRIVWPLTAGGIGADSKWYDIKEVQQVDGLKYELVIAAEQLAEVPPR